MTLTVQGLSKNFGNVQALRTLSFSAEGGSPFGLLGRNGAGKTTAMRIIMNIFDPDSGEVLLDGVPLKSSGARLGYLPEERGLYRKMEIGEQLVYFGMLRGLSKSEALSAAKRWLERLGMADAAKRKVEALSKGNQQRVQLAIALINDPEVVILDEPFSGLDPVNAMQLREAVREVADRGSIVIFSSHQMSAVENFCNDILILHKGETVLGGRLTDIRAGFPRNRIKIIASADTEQTARQTALRRGSISPLREGFMLTLEDERGREGLLAELVASGADIYTFETVEPTLEEIFVSAAGGEPEAQGNGGEEK